MDAWTVVRGFECELAKYTGAPYCVAVNSCTFALRLAFGWAFEWGIKSVVLPFHTYRSVANMAYDAGLEVVFKDIKWEGVYNIGGSLIWDCALRLAPNMYLPGQIQCLSFHPQKPLALSSGGGAILHGNPDADKYFKRMRFDGRDECPIKESGWEVKGLHGYMFPGQAGEAWHRLDIFKQAHPEGLTMPQPDYENIAEKWEEI